jgi:hypothetical protein
MAALGRGIGGGLAGVGINKSKEFINNARKYNIILYFCSLNKEGHVQPFRSRRGRIYTM